MCVCVCAWYHSFKSITKLEIKLTLYNLPNLDGSIGIHLNLAG